MKDGVSKTGCFLLFLSAGVMRRPYVQVTYCSSFVARALHCVARSDLRELLPVCSLSLSFALSACLRHHQFELRTAIELGKKIVLVHGESHNTRTSLRAVGDRSCVTDARPPVPVCLPA